MSVPCPLFRYSHYSHAFPRPQKTRSLHTSENGDSVAEDHSQNDLPPPESPRQPPSASSMKESDLPASIRENEYESGRVICEVCEEGVSIRDEETGGFSISKWTAHRKSWWAISERRVPAEGLFLIHSFSQARAHTPDHAKIPSRHNHPNLHPFLRPPPPASRYYRLSERNVGLSDRRRSVSTSSELIHMLPSSRPIESSVPAVTNGSGCVVTPAIAPFRGKPIARAAWLRKGGISRCPEISPPFDLVSSVQKPVLKVETDRRLCENCSNWVVLGNDDREADTKWAQHKLECARTALSSSHAVAKRHHTDSPTYVQRPYSNLSSLNADVI